MEDHQVIAFLAARLRERGCRAHLRQTGANRLARRLGSSRYRMASRAGGCDCSVLSGRVAFAGAAKNPAGNISFEAGERRVANPALAVISESKRFPLVWESLSDRIADVARVAAGNPRPAGRALGARRWLAAQDRDVQHGRYCQQARVDAAPGLAADATGPQIVPGQLGGATAFRVRARFHAAWIAARVRGRIHRERAGRRRLCAFSEKPVIDFAATDVALLLDDDE